MIDEVITFWLYGLVGRLWTLFIPQARHWDVPWPDGSPLGGVGYDLSVGETNRWAILTRS